MAPVQDGVNSHALVGVPIGDGAAAAEHMLTAMVPAAVNSKPFAVAWRPVLPMSTGC